MRRGAGPWRGLCLAKIPSAFIFIAFQLAPVGRSNRLLTVMISRLPFTFWAGWIVESAWGISPQAAHGTVREPLGSYGSYRPAVGLNPRLQW